MNQNYVRKCEEYLQNIPSQKLPPSSSGGASRPNLSSRKLTQPGLRPGRQSINNAIPPPAEGSRPKPKPAPVPATGGRRTPCRPPTARPGQLGSKFIRPCCRPRGGDTAGERTGQRGSDNVNQNDVRVMDGAGAGWGGEGLGEGRATGKTRTWDGILTAESTVETTAAASLTQIKSKATPPSPQAEPSPITSTFPNGAGAAPDNRDLTLAPNPSLTSLPSSVTSSSVRPASSSIAAVPPRPRPSSTVLDAVTELVPSSTASTARAEQVNQKQLQGINLFRFDPLRTLQFLTLELKSKLKPLLLTVRGGSSADVGSAHKQLYKISKELLYAVKILTENAERQRNPSCSCGDKETSDGKVPNTPKGREITEVPSECQNCLKLQRVERPGSACLPRKEINYPKDSDLPHNQPEEPSKASTTADQQLELRRLEGEIKRLQTTISDKQTTTATADGLIDDLNRKLGEATHARDEAQRKLLYATLENERLNFLLRSQCSTMANLRHDFSAIQSLADQQIDLLDRTTDTNGGTNDRSRSKSNTIATTAVVVGNHHRNYRYPSGSAQLNPAPPVQGMQVAKLRHHRHYSFQNIAEKESDDGNDAAAANDYWRNSASQQQPSPPSQEPEVMVRLPSSTHVPEEGAFQKREERLPTGLWHRKNRALVELDESGTSSSGSLVALVKPARSARFGPTKRALLIDSDRDDDLRDDLEGQQQQHSSSSLSSLTSSQQLRREGRGQDDQLGNNNNNNGMDLRTETGSRRGLPASGDKPFIMTAKGDDAESCSDYTNNNSHHRHIPNSKTNDCVSLAPKDAEMARNRRQQQLGPNPGGSKKNDDTPLAGMEAKGKYPGDYGDKFERRESLLALLGNGGQEERRQELCQNRPIMGQIRRRSSSLETGKEEAEEVLVGKIISAAAANEPAPGQTSRTMTKTTRTEEFSIDFDDITLPPSPIPFRRRKDEEGGGAVDEFPSSFGDWM
uniref:(northern house mosquito) hypothetical protein n=1 Tax=Culex pipiens TaxID=7175 RepID=A0A8D8FVG6_CULPI